MLRETLKLNLMKKLLKKFRIIIKQDKKYWSNSYVFFNFFVKDIILIYKIILDINLIQEITII